MQLPSFGISLREKLDTPENPLIHYNIISIAVQQSKPESVEKVCWFCMLGERE
jgi:hypothetical protein